MRRFYLFGFLLLICFDTLGQVGFKLAAVRTAPATFDADWLVRIFLERWIYLSVAGYLGAFFTWMTLLRHAPIGPAFAASHSEIVPVLLISVFFLGERLSGLQIMGGLLIAAGLGLLAMRREEG
ncbi:MAG: EamA family transporter [Nitrospirae bacterium]|nr:EamA family transporter [Candidatus Manganitrophaceae bacterium]